MFFHAIYQFGVQLKIDVKIFFFACTHRHNFVAKCGGTAWCETNIFIWSMQ